MASIEKNTYEKKSRALALDLGSTSIKAGIYAEGSWLPLISAPAPALFRRGLVCECDALSYVSAVEGVMKRLEKHGAPGMPLGIACQRSSFLLWDKGTGFPVTPLISWQDRRAEALCSREKKREPFIRKRTGLVLSPHYAGPKLSVLLKKNPHWKRDMERGSLLFGTLDTFLVWKWSGGEVFETDGTMASRTLLADLKTGNWSEELLDFFGVPKPALPNIVPASGRNVALKNGLCLRAALSDQAAGALCALKPGANQVLVNLGTGGFVLKPLVAAELRGQKNGYLCGPLPPRGFAMEGTINGIGASALEFGKEVLFLKDGDSTPEAFCIPDSSGVGAPHWKAKTPLTFSKAAESLTPQDKRRVVLEGIVFRVCEIVGELFKIRSPARIVLAGGLSQDPFLQEGIAACLNQGVGQKRSVDSKRRVEWMPECEATLLGAARLALGLPPFANPETRRISPGERGRFLPEKFKRWKRWMKRAIKTSSAS